MKELIISILPLFLVVGLIVLYLKFIYSLLNKYQLSSYQKSVWLMIMLFAPFLGLLIFIAVHSNNKR